MINQSLNISFNEELAERPVMATQGSTTIRSYRVRNFVTGQYFVVTETFDVYGQLITQERHGSFGPGMGQPC